jgi:hypothetical protein
MFGRTADLRLSIKHDSPRKRESINQSTSIFGRNYFVPGDGHINGEAVDFRNNLGEPFLEFYRQDSLVRYSDRIAVNGV